MALGMSRATMHIGRTTGCTEVRGSAMATAVPSAVKVTRASSLYRSVLSRRWDSDSQHQRNLVQRQRTQTKAASSDVVVVQVDSAAKRVQTANRVVIASCAAFAICTMDKVNISVAIIPMAQEFGWNAGAAGLVQSSFFAGYLLMQLPGGYLASRLGGRRVLPVGVATWSLGTALAPLMAATVPTLGISRAMVGLGQAIAPTSIVDMLARTVPKEQRSSAVSLAFSGTHVGAIIALLSAPLLIQMAGWRGLFFVFGAAGFVWYVAFEAFMSDVLQHDPETAAKLTTSMAETKPVEGEQREEPKIPYRAFLRSPAVLALCFTHFTNNWFHYTFLAWMPSYFIDTLHLENLSHAAHTSVLPPIAGIACSMLAGPVADKLINSGWPVPRVRKIMQNIALMGPALCMLVPLLDKEGNGWVVPLITAALGLSSFSLAGLYCTHQDMSPKYAGALLSLTNTSGALAGTAGVFLTGVLRDTTHSWDAALLIPNIALLLAGSACFTIVARNEPVNFDEADNSPLPFEHLLDGPKAAALAAVHGLVAQLEALLPHPPKSVVQAARQARLAAERLAMIVTAKRAAGGAPAVAAAAAAASMTPTASTDAVATGSFVSLVAASLTGLQGASSSSSSMAPRDAGQGAVLVSHWTTMTMMPDVEDDFGEVSELTDAEEEVQRIIEDMKRRGQI